MRLAIVDFPEPDGPTSAVISPARAVKLIWCKASVRVASVLFCTRTEESQFVNRGCYTRPQDDEKEIDGCEGDVLRLPAQDK